MKIEAVLSYTFTLQQNAHVCIPLKTSLNGILLALTVIFTCQQISGVILEHLYISKNIHSHSSKKDKERHDGGCALVHFCSARLRRLQTHCFRPIQSADNRKPLPLCKLKKYRLLTVDAQNLCQN
jgi:hypothetical protein